MRRLAFLGPAVAALALMALAQTAAANNDRTAVQTDPKASSPAGVIYQIPLNSARRSAAPVLPAGSHGGGPGGGAGSKDPSSIHSENGFGSSSSVPGVSPAALRIGAGVPAAHTAGSFLPTFLLIAIIAAAAIVAGVLATAVRRRHTEGTDYPASP